MSVRRLSVLHLAFTLAMVGVMTTVQLVVYPQYDLVDPADFSEYVRSHGQRIGWPLAAFAPAEVALALLMWLRAPARRLKMLTFASGALLAFAWIVTMVWFAPLHGRLISDPYDPERIDQLVTTNWIRTIVWWVRGGLAVWIVAQLSHLGAAD